METWLVNEKRDISKRRIANSLFASKSGKSNCIEPHNLGNSSERIIPLQAKPVCWTDANKDPKTIIGANARPVKHDKGKEGLKTQTPWLPGYRYSKEDNLLIERLSEYDKADRRFLTSPAM